MKKKLLCALLLACSLTGCQGATVAEESTSGQFTLESGEVVKYNVPEGHFDTTEDFIESLGTSYGITGLDLSNTMFTGNAQTLYGSKEAINAMALSDLIETLETITGQPVDDAARSTAYTYMTTGEINASESEENYKIEELESIVSNNVTYRVFEVYYETTSLVDDTETGSQVPNTTVTNCLQVYSNTEDTVEIIVYTGDYNRERALTLLNEFLGV